MRYLGLIFLSMAMSAQLPPLNAPEPDWSSANLKMRVLVSYKCGTIDGQYQSTLGIRKRMGIGDVKKPDFKVCRDMKKFAGIAE